MSPTHDALKKLAVALKISIRRLFSPLATNQINGCVVVTKSDQGTAHATSTYEY